MKFLTGLLLASWCFIFSATVLVAQPATGTQLSLSSKAPTLSFSWQGDSIHSKWEANAAMIIPVKFKGCPRTFYMQFDLGAPASVFYKNKLEAIQVKYPGVAPAIEAGGRIKEFSFLAGRVSVIAKEIMVKQFDSSTIDWGNRKGIEIIGTLGSDLIDGKVMILNYPDKKIRVLQNLPEKLKQSVAFSNFTYINRSILLPAKVNDKESLLFFDTGSSMFELLANKETCLQLAIPGEKPVQYAVKSWGRTLTANTYASSGSVNMANNTLSLRSVTYMEGTSNAQVERMLKAGIGGMVGNKLFLNHILIVDTKNRKFGLVSSLKRAD